MNDCFKKVLVVSHNPFSKEDNMGITLASYFKGWDINNLSQFYFHPGKRDSDICNNYFYFSDMDALKSVFNPFHYGFIFNCSINTDYEKKGQSDIVNKVYQKGRRRNKRSYIIRNIIWSLSHWNSKKFKKWIKDISPDVIFFASGDYAFAYKIVNKVSKKYKIPIITCCFDDYYINKRNNRGLGFLLNFLFMKVVKKTIKRSAWLYATNPMMQNEYMKLFNKKFDVLYTGANKDDFNFECYKKKKISYIGNLSLGRYKQLIEIGRVLKESKYKNLPNHIDVYSKETKDEILEKMSIVNGIVFHGGIGISEVNKIMKESIALIHVESFNYQDTYRTKYSLSTKISSSLMSGTPLLAYGPKDIASMNYLIDNNCSLYASNVDELQIMLKKLDNNDIEDIVNNSKKIAEQNHNQDKIRLMIKRKINEIVNGDENEK